MVTQYLMDRDNSLRLDQEPSNENYKMFNTGGVETEVGEFLYGFVRMTKPKNIFETGTHLGVSSSYMGQALKENGHGLLTTVEINKDFIKQSQERWERIGISNHIICDKEKSLDYFLEYEVDMMFLDSEPEFRFKELLRFKHMLKPGGYAFIHDLHQHMHQIPNEEHGYAWPYGKLPKEFIAMINADEFRVCHFETPRGLTMFYKVSPQDYNWKQ